MAALGGALARSVMKSSQASLAVRMAFAAAQAVPQKALDLPLIGPLWDTLMRWAKPAGVWPPTRKGAPIYVVAWASVICWIFFGFIRKGHRTKESEWEKARKRSYIQASLENMMTFEDARLAEEAEAAAASSKEGSDDGSEAGKDNGAGDRAPTKQDSDEEPENFCRPSVNPLMRSAASIYGAGALGIMLTGMGSDGLDGARELVRAGGTLLAQDRTTSVVWGMPGAVVRAGLAAEVLPLDDIAASVARQLGRPR